MNRLTQYRIKRGIVMTFRVFAVILAVLLVAVGIFFGINRFSLAILPIDGETVEIGYGEIYQDPGGEARLVGSLWFRTGIPVSAEVTAEYDVNTDTLGAYPVKYSGQWLFWEGAGSRAVHVVDRIAPVITLQTLEEHLTIVGETYEEEGFTAVDEYDGDITDRVTATEESGVVTYRVSDASGNEAVVQRQIRYYDPIFPELTLIGGTVTMDAGDTYVEPGYTAWDNGNGDITDWVEIFTDLNPYLAGNYQVTYTVADGYGNVTTVHRDVVVKAKTRPATVMPTGKVIYLTFDDCPSQYTRQLLEVLKRNDVKATFFVCDTEHVGVIQEIAAAGHVLGVHSETHNYRRVYDSVDAYFDDMLWMRKRIYETTGVETNLVRFPGGSSNTVSKFNPGIMTVLTQAVEDCGYTYFDWNVDSNDAGGAETAEEVFENVQKGILWAMKEYGFALVLQHDTQEFSIQAVEKIIQWGKANGYTFLTLQETSPTSHHYVNN